MRDRAVPRGYGGPVLMHAGKVSNTRGRSARTHARPAQLVTIAQPPTLGTLFLASLHSTTSISFNVYIFVRAIMYVRRVSVDAGLANSGNWLVYCSRI